MPTTSAAECLAGRLALLLAVLAALWPAPVRAWGREGHRVTGLIANELLTAQSRAGLRALLGSDDLSLAATWADDYRAPLAMAYPGSATWHFDDIPLCGKAVPATFCAGGNCASSRISHFLQLARDTSLSREKRADAVRFLVHFIGDLQQPLHASDNADRGGNEVQVEIPGMSQPAKLHYAWDTLFVRTSLRGRSEGEFALALLAAYRRQLPGMQAGNLESWLAESHQLAAEVVYDGLDGALHCPLSSAGQRFVLSNAYVARASQVVQTQLAKAGARIALVVNRLFAQQ